jgi:N-acetylmuramoyl-L-alanine amidase
LGAIAEMPLQRTPNRALAPKSNSKKIHRVRSGENLNLIAKNYATSVQALMQMNGLTKTSINAGQTLIVRTSNASAPTNSKAVASHKSYKVRKGDNLNSLAKKFQTEVTRIMKLNNLKKSSLQVGQVIKIPTRG